jgi:hypothetical protein
VPGNKGQKEGKGGKLGTWPTVAAFIEFNNEAAAARWVDVLNGAALWTLGPGQLRAFTMIDYMEVCICLVVVLCFCLMNDSCGM